MSNLDEKKIRKLQKADDAHRLWIEKNLRNYSESRIIKFKPYTMNDVNKSSSQNLFNVVSTFAGGGGSSTGYRLAG